MDLLENIRIFKRVAESGSFSGAARELRLSQPTVSKTVAALEAELGVSLLRRTTRGLSVTTEGQKVLQQGTRLLDDADSLVASIQSSREQLRGKIHVGVSLAFARLGVAPMVDAFHQKHPDLRFFFQLSDSFVDLVEQNLDLAIRIGDLPDSSLRAIRIGQSRRAFFAAPSYLKKFGTPQTLEALHQHRLLYYTRLADRPSWPVLPEPFIFEPYLCSDGSDLIREAVLEGLGISLMPTWMMIDQKVLTVLPDCQTLSTPIYAVHAGNREMTARQR